LPLIYNNYYYVICVRTLPEGYIPNVPLPRVPILQSNRPKTRHQIHTKSDYHKSSYVGPTYGSPCSIIKRAAFVFSPAWHAIATND
jgi:hypothetical protein